MSKEMQEHPEPPKPKYQFSLRGLLLLTTWICQLLATARIDWYGVPIVILELIVATLIAMYIYQNNPIWNYVFYVVVILFVGILMGLLLPAVQIRR